MMRVRRRDLGTMDYASCWELQRSLFEELLAEKNRRRRDGKAGNAANNMVGNAADETANGVANNVTGYATNNAVENRIKSATDHGNECPEADAQNRAGTILLVEHPPVYTLGKSGHAANLLVDDTALKRLGAKFFRIDRGGDITFHGPGQTVCYPILDLEKLGIGLREYIDSLEEAVIRTVAEYGIAAGRIAGASGVWIGTGVNGFEPIQPEGNAARWIGPETMPATRGGAPRKICAIGVRSSRFVTMHGFALNVSTDLEWFSHINPCGFVDRGATSIERETGRKIAIGEVNDSLVENLGKILNVKIYK